MRLRNVKNKDNIMATGRYYIDNPMDYKGIWNNVFSNNNPTFRHKQQDYLLLLC